MAFSSYVRTPGSVDAISSAKSGDTVRVAVFTSTLDPDSWDWPYYVKVTRYLYPYDEAHGLLIGEGYSRDDGWFDADYKIPDIDAKGSGTIKFKSEVWDPMFDSLEGTLWNEISLPAYVETEDPFVQCASNLYPTVMNLEPSNNSDSELPIAINNGGSFYGRVKFYYKSNVNWYCEYIIGMTVDGVYMESIGYQWLPPTLNDWAFAWLDTTPTQFAQGNASPGQKIGISLDIYDHTHGTYRERSSKSNVYHIYKVDSNMISLSTVSISVA